MNLDTTYLGIKLRTPLVPWASPLSENLDNIKRMEDAGASAIVFHSLFEEQIRLERENVQRGPAQGKQPCPQAATWFAQGSEFPVSSDAYLAHIVRAKAAVRLPIIGSLNGPHSGVG